MENKQRLCAHALLVVIGLTQCLAVKHITAMKGQTLTLTCPIKNINGSDHVEWRNPDGFLMFFNKHRALKDMRNEIVALTQSQYSVRISDITFKDGGVYKCLHYSHRVMTKRYKVVVLSGPVLEKTEHEDKTIIKCSASANGHPPRLSWLLENGLEMEAQPNYVLENTSNKHTAVSLLHVKIHKRRVTVKCLAQHLALRGSPLIDFVHIGNQGEETSPTPGYISTTTEKVVTPTLVPRFSSTSFSSPTYSSGHLESGTTEGQMTGVSATSYNNTMAVNETTESVSETTEGTSQNTTTDSSNSTSGADVGKKDPIQNKKGNSALLVLLVTCLIFCLIVVLAFFLLRLRRAHLAWKQENEETDQSVESSRSKSSNEEKQKQNQQQRGQGFCNTNFTKYKVEEAAQSEAGTTPGAVEVPVEKPHSNNTVLRSCIRETEL
ncbi:cytotoxic and regulatory T-cell molecule isoform X1 [Pygocentrus nattereri]|uniref:Ig-like domain-containing protein n=2 Tax=Pygocentrus nattereri TaxID=42514 RepID=A0A3B4E5C8_PYGNA|nr:cytotoxic and regulatory T-cell molecule isoform X1 [Pygocentrus nattereri]